MIGRVLDRGTTLGSGVRIAKGEAAEGGAVQGAVGAVAAALERSAVVTAASAVTAAAVGASPPPSTSAVTVKTRRSGLLDAEECGRRHGSLEAAQVACEELSGCAGVTRHAKPFGCLTDREDLRTVAPEFVMHHGWW